MSIAKDRRPNRSAAGWLTHLMDLSDIQPDTAVEDVVAEFPQAATYLLEQHNLRVICCGAPVWATLGQIARTRGLSPAEVVDGLRAYLAGRT